MHGPVETVLIQTTVELKLPLGPCTGAVSRVSQFLNIQRRISTRVVPDLGCLFVPCSGLGGGGIILCLNNLVFILYVYFACAPWVCLMSTDTRRGNVKWKLPVSLESRLCQMMFFWAHRWKSVLLKQTQVKRHMMFRRHVHMFPWTVGGGEHCLHWWHTHVVDLWWLLQRTPRELPAASSCFSSLRLAGEPCRFFWIELPLPIHRWCLLSGLACSCWFVFGVC